MKKFEVVALIIVAVAIVFVLFYFFKPDISIDKNSSPINNENYTGEDINKVASEYGRFRANDNSEGIYERLSPTEKLYKTEEEFIKLYPLIFGRNSVSSAIVNNIEIEEDKAYVYYDLVYSSGYQAVSGVVTFDKINGKWYFADGIYGLVTISSCIELEDCSEGLSGERLKEICKNTCERRISSTIFIEENPFRCDTKNYQCSCICWNDAKTIGTSVAPF